MRIHVVAFSAVQIGLISQHARAQTCTRPTSTEGYAGYAYGSEVAQVLDSKRVRVWYTTSGLHAVRNDSLDEVPKGVARVADVAERALDAFATWGYRTPLSDDRDSSCGPNGGDGRLDLYLVHFRAADGSTIQERCERTGGATQCASFVLVESDFSTRYATADEGIRTVVPHELFHAVQNAYDAELDRYWAEGTAQWATKAFDPTLGDLERFLPAFFKESGRSIDAPPGGVTASFLYGAAVWPVFLEQAHGRSLVREVLETEASTGASALEAARSVFEKRGGKIESSWSEFWAWNASTGARYDANPSVGYANAARYPLLATRPLRATTTGVTSGTSGIAYYVANGTRRRITLRDSNLHQARFIPLVNGKSILSKALPLPVENDQEGLVVLTGVSTSKADAPYTLVLEAAPELEAPLPAPEPKVPIAPGAGGCAQSTRHEASPPDWTLVVFGLGAICRRRLKLPLERISR
jgi:hypothetical protein